MLQCFIAPHKRECLQALRRRILNAGKTNYVIDLCEGGTGTIAQNMFVQGKGKETRSGLIMVAAEARTYPSDGLQVEGNTASRAPGARADPAFVADLSGGRISVASNRLTGMRAFERR